MSLVALVSCGRISTAAVVASLLDFGGRCRQIWGFLETLSVKGVTLVWGYRTRPGVGLLAESPSLSMLGL
ncbi:hypothetical protein V6N13_040042 [Hibiscus sabdariffa]|uniref:Secreted protein n=1 Tax=Hibiscus sabdariffa TaxID=183260 RepID=A0ABR1ZKL8_9ROSI